MYLVRCDHAGKVDMRGYSQRNVATFAMHLQRHQISIAIPEARKALQWVADAIDLNGEAGVRLALSRDGYPRPALCCQRASSRRLTALLP
jgi:hypothetical protein